MRQRQDDVGEGAIQRILDDVSRAVMAQTRYQRVLISFYQSPLAEAAHAETRVLKYASRGLDPEDEEEIRLFVAGGGIVRGDKFDRSFRVRDSYYIPGDKAPYSLVPRIKSRRRFLSPEGWSAQDLLLIPIRLNGEIIGQISVDDPRDGMRPTRDSLTGLEELAAVAGVALNEAYALERLNERHRLFRSLSQNAITGTAIVQHNRFCYVNDPAVQILGYPREALLVMEPWWQVIHPEERKQLLREGKLPAEKESFEARGICRDGNSVWLRWTKRPIEYREHEAILFQLIDISERVRAETFLKQKALHDPLTGLFNRFYFDETVYTELKRSQRYKRPFTLMMTDLAGFKIVNDKLGHQEGDKVLKGVAHVIQDQIRESDWAIRYGGDEFLLVLPETGRGVEALAHRLQMAIEQWGKEYLRTLPLHIDIGWATWDPKANLSLQELLQLADSKMYRQKAARREEIRPTTEQ